MRFSTVFQPKPTSPAPAREDEPRTQAAEPPARAAEPELPEDLDARVRLVGEWQLGDG